MNEPAGQSPEQLRYATLLEWCARIGLVLTVLAFAAYVVGLVPSRVPTDRLAELWTMPVEQYLKATGLAPGWGWLADVRHGDMASLAGIALLSGCSVVPLVALLPLYLRRGDRAFVALCLAQVAVIALAASGWIGVGH
ncbi:MAG: hypothetical protein KIT17_14525 [Rubrivivax sp.]|nr:hypothetical protein [Rubrivivax sp.]